MDKTESEVRQILIEAMKAQLEKPTRACSNNESSFVAYRLRKSGYPRVAERYWAWTCGPENREEFGDEIYELQMKLKEIDREFVMPDWGTYGT